MAENLKIPSEILEPQILVNAVNDLSFFMKIRQYLDTNHNEEKSFFSDIKYQEVFNLYSKFFEKFSKKPKKKTLLTLIDRTESDDEVKLYKNSIVEKMYDTSSEEIDQEYIEEETIKFIKENRVYEAMISSQNDMETGNYDNILTKMEDAIKVSFDKDLGTSILDVDEVINQLNEVSSSHAISTGYPNLDSFLDAGFHGGELYSPAGIPGAGKSLILCNFAINMFLQGYKVQLYTFEVSVKRILTRLISNLTNMSKQEIFLDEEGVKEKLQEMLNTGGDIRLKEYPANEANANMLLAHINDMSMYEDFEADGYLIDHLLIQATNDRRLNPEDSYTYYKKVTEETRNIAKKTDRPVIAPTQINREGMSDRGGSKAVVTGKNVASSRGIIDTVDCFWPIAQSAKDKEDGRMYLIGDKSRNDRSGWKIQYHVDYEHMKITEGHIVN